MTNYMRFDTDGVEKCEFLQMVTLELRRIQFNGNLGLARSVQQQWRDCSKNGSSVNVVTFVVLLIANSDTDGIEDHFVGI